MFPKNGSASAVVVHLCLEPDEGAIALDGNRLTDGQRLALVLQLAGLLSLLGRAGWGLGQRALALAPGPRLLAEARPGEARRPVREELRELAGRLFGSRSGKGPARRAVRVLEARWGPSLAPLSPDEAAGQILDAAPFLWEERFGLARRALAGELRDGFWVAGPRSFRRRVLARGGDPRDVLASEAARALWNREEEGRPRDLAAAGRWRAAVAAWEREPPAAAEERVELAEALFCLGRFEAALAALEGLRSTAAEIARARCQLRLGELGAARNALRRLEEAPLTPAQAAELAGIAARVFANSGESAEAWIQRALMQAEEGTAALAARLAAAEEAWDRRDLAAMDRWLEAARPATGLPALAWRWHQARALRALQEPGGGSEAAAHAARALRASRRRLPRHEAAGLWSDLGLARARAGDLPGAERAFLHAVRLFEACDGPRKVALALYNLAEIRLRRGRLAGVAEILERSLAEDRRAGNLRALMQDAELQARYELALCRPEAALAVCREALAQGHPWHREELHAVAARALGWLGRPAEAAAELSRTSPAALEIFEPEEGPALFALAGDLPEAVRKARGTPFEPVWEALHQASLQSSMSLSSSSPLEPYRAARLIFDLRTAAPLALPAPFLRSIAPSPALAARDLSQERPPEPLRDPRDRSGMVGESPALLAALGRIARLAPGDLPVLILGESGTGKELAAREIHRASARAHRPFVAVNCAALSETLILSDLFGHSRGAFTGADRDHKGVFETADGGTVFLDEIGDLPLSAQGLLLRVLQEGEVRSLGKTLPRKVNVRVLAATHRDLAAMVAERTFRQDLYYRLKVGSIALPPLRERGEDVLRLAERFLAPPVRLSKEARACLLAYDWPGNIRELQNILGVAAALAEGDVILPHHLELPAPRARRAAAPTYHEAVEAYRRGLIEKALAEAGGNQSAAAHTLGLSRQSLSYLVRQLGIEVNAGGRVRAE